MGDTRVTQGGGYVLADQANATGARVTEGGGYVLTLSQSLGVRDTQGGGYVIRGATADTRVCQANGYVLVRTLKPGCMTNDVHCWRIERADGRVFLFTSHDQTVNFRGDDYSPCSSLSQSALQTSSEFGSVENLDLSGIISSALISITDLWAGRFDGAEVEVWRVDWTDTSKADLLAAGRCGALDMGSTSFKFEVTTASDRLAQRPILQPVTPSCRFKLGDARCTVDLEALRVMGNVTSIPSPNVQTGAQRRIFTDTGRSEADDYFQLGSLTWETGNNTGLTVDVKLYASRQFVLERAMQYNIEVGDGYSVVPGCDRILTTCDTKFSNAINFGGFPHLRGTDDLQKQPTVKGG